MMETATQDTYKAPRDEGEYARLHTQHELVKAAMGGKLLLAPVDLSGADLRVLDSGTAQALWPLDLARQLRPTAAVVGTDIAPQHFPPEEARPANLTLAVHSIFEPWPASMRGAFDAVHQRFVLAACTSQAQAAAAVAELFACVRPGGWIELHEGNMVVVRNEGSQHAAMARFRDVAVAAWASIGQLPDPGPRVGQWLRDAGAVDVVESVQVIKLGPEAESKQDGDRALAMLLHMLDGMKNMVGGRPGHPSMHDFDKLKVDLVKEVEEVGNFWQYHLAYGRKPERY
ncbi:hypothetical protein MKZ38_000477 [Zalerion maritima]|uniref:Methyltransferase domain-containing protein n=1 Tax=Zalerion maritima TaxID=339359 RepID=A0AAD5WS15_9PEZI|nr:hypothetical protein MKZ38_000477 [Zalerion maritima]